MQGLGFFFGTLCKTQYTYTAGAADRKCIQPLFCSHEWRL